MSTQKSREAREVANLLSLPRMRHPQNGHAFYRTIMASPKPCEVCGKRVLLFGAPCRCLLCGILVHRQCYSRAVHAKKLARCQACPEELEVFHDGDDGTATSGDADEDEQDGGKLAAPAPEMDTGRGTPADGEDVEERIEGTLVAEHADDTGVSIDDDSYRSRQLQRASLLAGATLVGGALGGPAGAILGVNGAAKAGCAVVGATFGYRRARRKQMTYESIAPPMEGIPAFWAQRAEEVRKRASLWTTPLSYSSSDQAVQVQLEGCNLDERVNVFVVKLLFDPKTIPGALCDSLVVDYGQRHATGSQENSEEDPSRRTREGAQETSAVAEADADGKEAVPPKPSPILDALGLIHEVLSSVFQYHMKLAESEETIMVTINAVDRVVLAPLYDNVMKFLIGEHKAADDALTAKLAGLSIPDQRINQDAMRAVASAISARTAYDKLLCFTRFVECVSASCDQKSGSSADDLLPALCSHVVASEFGGLHAEMAFIELFSRNDFMLLGREGYALTSVQAAITALDNAPSAAEVRAMCDDHSNS